MRENELTSVEDFSDWTNEQVGTYLRKILTGFAKEQYQRGYAAGLAAQQKQQAPPEEDSSSDNVAQSAEEIEAAPPDLRPAGDVFQPKNFRHIAGQFQKTLCGFEIFGVPQLEVAEGDRVSCPLCLAEMN